MKGGKPMSIASGVFRDINKVALEDLNNSLQTLIGLIQGDHDKLSGVAAGATKVEVNLTLINPSDPSLGTKNADNGYILINDKRTNVYTHPDTHPVTMITGLADVATSADYNDLINCPTELPASDVYPWAKEPVKPTYTPQEVGAISITEKGVINGVAELDEFGWLPKEQLPEMLQDFATNGYLPQIQLPTIDITRNLVDNVGVVLILGGLNSALPSGGITNQDLENAKQTDHSNELYPGVEPTPGGPGGITQEELEHFTPGTATKDDILYGEVAWVNGKRVTGAIPVYSADDADGTTLDLYTGEVYTTPAGYYKEGALTVINDKRDLPNTRPDPEPEPDVDNAGGTEPTA